VNRTFALAELESRNTGAAVPVQPSLSDPRGVAVRDFWSEYVARYRRGEYRAVVFRDMVLEEAERFGGLPTFLDIGCGSGFDGDRRLQKSLAARSGRYIGIEPDPAVPVGEYFHEVHRCILEESAIPARSIDIAFAVMVLEHVSAPSRFLKRVHEVLVDGGVFLGFTMDARHHFCALSACAQQLGLKHAYLRLLHRSDGNRRSRSYPSWYRANCPSDLEKDTGLFKRCEWMSFSRIGEVDWYLPRLLRPIGRFLDRFIVSSRRPGSILVVRLEK